MASRPLFDCKNGIEIAIQIIKYRTRMGQNPLVPIRSKMKGGWRRAANYRLARGDALKNRNP
jgi:hypothetical protein